MIKIAFLGAGKMASAMIEGLLAKKYYTAAEIGCTSAADGTGEALSSRLEIAFTADLKELLAEPAIVVCAFKPQQMGQMSDRHAALTADKLILSILAGTPVAKLAEKFPKARNIVRSMPNTPGQIGAGITAYAARAPLSGEDKEAVEKVLGALGQVLPVEEKHLDAVTAVSGSGPAYLFEFVAALRDGGVKAGLLPETACQLALQTALGAARLLAHTRESPETLRDRVTSPGGTTLAGLEVMKKHRFRAILEETVQAAKNRSIELSAM